MKKKFLILGLFYIFILSACSVDNTQKEEVAIWAAASLENALEEIEVKYESEHQNIDLIFNFGGSGTLVTQIQEGAPADIVFLASSKNYEILEEEDRIQEGEELLKNSLVVITNKENPTTTIDKADKIAIGTPEAVPAGTYAKQSLQAIGVWEDISDKLVQTKDVTEVLSYVASNNVDLGIVYNTDALSSTDVEVTLEIADDLHDPIVYPLGLLTDNENSKDFYEYLQTDEAINIFESYGFLKNDE